MNQKQIIYLNSTKGITKELTIKSGQIKFFSLSENILA